MLRSCIDFARNTLAIALPASPVLGAVAGGLLTQGFLGMAAGLFAGPLAVTGLIIAGTPLWNLRKDMNDREQNEKHGIPLPAKAPRTLRQKLQATKEFFGVPAVASAAAIDYAVMFVTLELYDPRLSDRLGDWLRPDLAGPGKTAAPPPPEVESSSFTSLNLRDCFASKKTPSAEPPDAPLEPKPGVQAPSAP